MMSLDDEPRVLRKIDGRDLMRALYRMPRGHELLPDELASTLPALYSTENVPEPAKVCRVKFFTPIAGWTWYAIEYAPADRLFFGYVLSGLDPAYDELGYFSLDELEGLGAAVERDFHFEPTKLDTIIVQRRHDLERRPTP